MAKYHAQNQKLYVKKKNKTFSFSVAFFKNKNKNLLKKIFSIFF
jgi:hypothetical protein